MLFCATNPNCERIVIRFRHHQAQSPSAEKKEDVIDEKRVRVYQRVASPIINYYN